MTNFPNKKQHTSNESGIDILNLELRLTCIYSFPINKILVEYMTFQCFVRDILSSFNYLLTLFKQLLWA